MEQFELIISFALTFIRDILQIVTVKNYLDIIFGYIRGYIFLFCF